MLLDHYRAMARNNAWSNLRLYRACAELNASDYKAQRPSFFGSIHLILNHILIVDWLYLDALEGLAKREFAGDEAIADFATLSEAQSASDRRLIAYCDGLGEPDFNREVILPREAGPRRDSVQAILIHLFIHQVHHRGQVHGLLSQTQVPPPQLDEFFLAEDEPKRRAEIEALGLEPR